MDKILKEKANDLTKIALYLALISIVIQGLIKIIFNVGWYNAEINEKIAEFYLFKNVIAQTIIMQISLMFNFVIVVAISNNGTIKGVFKKIWWILPFTYLLNYINKDIASIMQLLICIGLCCVYDYKNVIKASFASVIIFALMGIYQVFIMFIRHGYVEQLNYIFTFYEQITLIINMYIIMYLVYRVRRIKHG